MSDLQPVPLDQSESCVGCGRVKKANGRPSSATICCQHCWKRLPKWLRDAFVFDHRWPTDGPRHGPTIWQNRISLMLQWQREYEGGESD